MFLNLLGYGREGMSQWSNEAIQKPVGYIYYVNSKSIDFKIYCRSKEEDFIFEQLEAIGKGWA